MRIGSSIPMLLEDAGKGYSSRSHSRALALPQTSSEALESKAYFNFIGSALRRDAR